jgi:rod shape determining protein RodA
VTRLARWRLRLPEVDLPILIAAAGLVTLGLLTVYSATSIMGAHQGLWVRQLQWVGLALIAASIAASVHYRVYDALAYPVYGLSLVLLAAVMVVGSERMGAKRWLEIGPLSFQPSEVAKIATVFVLARRLDDPRLDLRRIRGWLPPLLLTLVPCALVAKEPDLGTALSFPAILVVMYFWAGMPAGNLLLGLTPVANVVLFFATGSLWWFAGLFAALLAVVRPRVTLLVLAIAVNGAVSYAVPHLWDRLHDYQKRRIETFLNPGADPYGAGYQIIQSKIAIGSGGLFGKGYATGTQSQLNFIPEKHTDFIFPVIAEEWGFLGSAVTLALFGWFLARGLQIALEARDAFGSYVALGILSLVATHVVVNLGMVTGLLPTIGIPLPLISYGGSSIITTLAGVGLILNVHMRRTAAA